MANIPLAATQPLERLPSPSRVLFAFTDIRRERLTVPMVFSDTILRRIRHREPTPEPDDVDMEFENVVYGNTETIDGNAPEAQKPLPVASASLESIFKRPGYNVKDVVRIFKDDLYPQLEPDDRMSQYRIFRTELTKFAAEFLEPSLAHGHQDGEDMEKLIKSVRCKPPIF
uniref:Uncharacterized protein n=1 Tax=Mycena chlorophos TaxID=658473 RepID=A0ABQ0KUD4_MYCCL|nr:predicted protein [Mycena chlorophos]